jgi:hypothetical protein
VGPNTKYSETMNNYCRQCGLMFRKWAHRTEEPVCDECNPKEFKELHEKNLRTNRRRSVGQQHITENTFFPKLTPRARQHINKRYLSEAAIRRRSEEG